MREIVSALGARPLEAFATVLGGAGALYLVLLTHHVLGG